MMAAERAYHRIQDSLFSWEVLDVSGAIVLEAVGGVLTYKWPLGCPALGFNAFTSDFAHIYRGIHRRGRDRRDTLCKPLR